MKKELLFKKIEEKHGNLVIDKGIGRIDNKEGTLVDHRSVKDFKDYAEFEKETKDCLAVLIIEDLIYRVYNG